jgi:hypothetical protein
MRAPRSRFAYISLLSLCVVTFVGCAEGPLWRLGYVSPWARKKWEEEENVVQSLFSRRDQLRDIAKRADTMPASEQEQVSRQLTTLFREDSVKLLRIEVVNTLAVLKTQTASDTLRMAVRDEDRDVRIAACKAWGERKSDEGVEALRSVLERDEDIDVRITATKSLASFQGPNAVEALGLALDDRDPALQHNAMASLEEVSGQDYGRSVVAWREFVRGGQPTRPEGPSIVERIRELF